MIAAIRVRGRTGIRKDIEDTLMMLKLTRINHAVLIEDNSSYKGMLQKAKDYITWGEVDEETVASLISRRGKLAGNVRVTEDYIKENTDFSSVEDLSKAGVSHYQVDMQSREIRYFNPSETECHLEIVPEFNND